MNAKKSIIRFIICLLLIIIGILFFILNMDRFIVDYRDEVIEKHTDVLKKSEDSSVKNRIGEVAVENGMVADFKKIEKLDDENTILQKSVKLFGEFSSMVKANTRENENIVIYELQKKDISHMTFIYELDKTSFYYYHYEIYSLYKALDSQELDIRSKEGVIQRIKELLLEIQIEELYDFEPNKLWILDNIYTLKDSNSNITIDYDIKRDKIIGFMKENKENLKSEMIVTE